MKTLLLIFALSGSSSCAQNASIDEQSNVKAENHLEATFNKIRTAKSEVLESIKAIKDPKKQALYASLFEKNENAWDDFIGTTALLQQGVKDLSTKPDIRYTRILDAEHSEF